MRKYYIKKVLIIFFLLFLYQCCSSEETVKNDEKFLNKSDYIKTVPRGMVEISFTINELIQKENTIILNSTIDKVHKYGAGVKPLTEGTNYSIEIDQELYNSNKNKLELGKQIKCRITSTSQSMDVKRANRLKLISILKERE